MFDVILSDTELCENDMQSVLSTEGQVMSM